MMLPGINVYIHVCKDDIKKHRDNVRLVDTDINRCLSFHSIQVFSIQYSVFFLIRTVPALDPSEFGLIRCGSTLIH